MDKPWYLSKTIIGGALAAGSSLFGLGLAVDDITQIVDHLESIVATIGGLLAIYGRLRVGK